MPARVQAWRDQLAEMGWTTFERARSAGWQAVATRQNESLLVIGLDRHDTWLGLLERARRLGPAPIIPATPVTEQVR